MKRYMSVREYAAQYNLRENYVYTLIKRGRIQGVKQVDGHYLIPVNAKRVDTGWGPKPRSLQ